MKLRNIVESYEGLPDEDHFVDGSVTCTGCNGPLDEYRDDFFDCITCSREWCTNCIPPGNNWVGMLKGAPEQQRFARRWKLHSPDRESMAVPEIHRCPACMETPYDDPLTQWLIRREIPPQTLEIADLILTKEEIAAAVSNLSRGLPSQTEGPLEVNFHPSLNQYQLTNGYHRLVEAMVRGETSVPVKDDGQAAWRPPSRRERFYYDPSQDYYGMEEFIEHYELRRL